MPIDLDLAIEGPAPVPSTTMGNLAEAFNESLLPWKVDLSLRHGIHNPELLEHIEREGVKLFENDSSRTLSANS